MTHKLTQHYAVTTPPRYLTTGNACKSRFIVIIPFPLTAPIPVSRSNGQRSWLEASGAYRVGRTRRPHLVSFNARNHTNQVEHFNGASSQSSLTFWATL